MMRRVGHDARHQLGLAAVDQFVDLAGLANWRTSRSTASNRWPDRKKPTAVFSSNRRSLMPQGMTSTNVRLLRCWSRANRRPTCQTSPPWLALATVAAANSKGFVDADAEQRRTVHAAAPSKAPALISASTVRLLIRVRSTRTAEVKQTGERAASLRCGPPQWRRWLAGPCL